MSDPLAILSSRSIEKLWAGVRVTESAEGRPGGYPYMSAATWGELRTNFRKSMPRGAVTKDYLQSILGISEKTAGNLLPQLRNVGIIDAEGMPTQLAKDFRDDEHYASACATIVETVYPTSLTDAFPEVEDNLNGIANWFMRNAGAGEQAAKYQARFYITLREADPTSLGERRVRASGDSKPAKKAASKKAPSASTQGTPKPDAEAQQRSEPQGDQTDRRHRVSRRPDVHIDIQIHIDASASNDQIDAVFASMSKHLYE